MTNIYFVKTYAPIVQSVEQETRNFQTPDHNGLGALQLYKLEELT